VEVEVDLGIRILQLLVPVVEVTVIQLLAQQAQPDRDLEAAKDEAIALTVTLQVAVEARVVPEAIGAKLELVNLLLDLGDKTAKAATVARA
jgi:hypothetical protein